jgi:autotransporter-associated beta strand protein
MAPFSWSRWLRSFVRPSVKAYRRPRRFRPLLVESLETRLAPATFVWTGAGSDNHWSTPANWAGGVAPTGNLDDLVFPALGVKGNVTTVDDIAGTGLGNATFNSISIAASYTLTGSVSLTLANPTGSGSVIVGAGAAGVVISIQMQLAATSSGQFFTVNKGADLTVNAPLTGVVGSELDKDGAGILILNEDGSGFEGSVAIIPNGGTLQIQTATALGDPTSGLTTTVGTNAQLQVSNIPASTPIQEGLVLNGTGTKTDGALLSVAGTGNTWAGTVTLDSDTAFGAAGGTAVTIANTITDLGAGHSVIKVGRGMVVFATADSYRGTTTVNDGILRIQNALSLGSGDGTPATAAIVNETATFDPVTGVNTIVASGTLQLDDPTLAGFTVDNHLLTLNGFGGLTAATGIGALDNNRGANTWTGDITFGTPQPSVFDVYIGAQIPDPPYTLTLTGLISQPPTSGYTFTKVGQGTVILTHPNVYTGATVVHAGILEITDSQGLGFSPICTVQSGATLELSVAGKTTDSVTGVANELSVSTPLNIDGLGFSNLGALYSQSGINTYTGTVTLTDLDPADFFGPPSTPDLPSGTGDDEAGIGVAGDPNQTNGPGYFTSDFSLTITGSLIGSAIPTDTLAPMRLDKLDTGNLILPNANLGLTSPIDIRQGWITAQNNNSLGTRVDGPDDARTGVPQPVPTLGDTLQPSVTVEAGAALHLDPLVGNLNIPQNLVLTGMGFNHVFGELNQQGAVENLAGVNTLSGNVVLKGQVGIGVEDVFGRGSQLRMTGSVSEKVAALTLAANASGGSAESDNIIDTGANSGTVTVNYNMYYIPDSMDIYYGIKGQPGSILIATTKGKVSGTGTLSAPYGPGTSTIIDIVVDDGGGLPGTAWTYTGTINPAGGLGGITKLGSQRLILQGDGTYTGPVDIKQGVLLDQNNTALGDAGEGTTGPSNTVTVESGAALELGSSVIETAGGLQAGVNTSGEHLILNGTGDSAFGDGALTVLSPTGAHNPISDPIVSTDQMWRGPVTLNTGSTIQVPTDSRLNIYGVIDDATNPAMEGSDLTFQGGGGLNLAGADTYRGVTSVTQGYVTLQNGLALGGSPISAVQTLTLTGAVAGMTQYQLTFGTATTGTLTFSGNDATAIQTALQKLTSIGGQGGIVTVSGAGNNYTITFGGNLTGFHQPQLSAALIAGPGSPPSVVTANDGSGGVIVSDAASLQLQGGVTVAGKPVIVQGQGLGSTPSTPLEWFNVGPAPQNNGQVAGGGPVTGRVTGVATDPTDPNVIYIATAGGGAWKTLNGGQTWIQLFDTPAAMYGGAIAIAPSDPRIIYYGTGEADNTTDSFAGTGLYKSIDSGRTWMLVTGLTAPTNPLFGLAISKIVVDYRDPNLVYVATSDLATNGLFQTSVAQGIPEPQMVGIWRFDGASWFNMTAHISLERNKATSSMPMKAPNTPGPDDDFRLQFPQVQATWSDLVLAKTDFPFTDPPFPIHYPNGILYAALGTNAMPSTGGPDPANGVYYCLDPADPLPVWDIGNAVTDGESSTEFPTNQINYSTVPFPQGSIKLTEFTQDIFFPNTAPQVLEFENDIIYASIAYPDNYPLPFVPPNPEFLNGQLFQIQTATAQTYNAFLGGTVWIPPSYKVISNEPPTLPDPTDGFPENVLGERGNQNQTLFTPDGVGLYIGGTEISPTTHAGHIYFSPDAGATASWQDISVDGAGNGPHTNDHALAMDASGRIILGNDGGVWRWDPTASAWTDINGNLSISNVNGVAVDPNNLNVAYAGSTDNGLGAFTGGKAWNQIDNGDGGLVSVDPLNPGTVYHVVGGPFDPFNDILNFNPASDALLVKSTAGTASTPASWTTILKEPLTLVSPGMTPYFPFVEDQINPQRLLAGGVYVPGFAGAIGLQESTDGGATWHDLSVPLPPPFSPPLFIPPSRITSVAIATFQGPFPKVPDPGFPLVGDVGANTYDPNTIYAVALWGDGSNHILVTKNHGASWVDRSSNLPAALLAEGTISHITVDPSKRDNVFVTNSGPADLSRGRVFRSADAGQTWEDLTGNLPDVPVYTVVIDPRTGALYAGTDQGVYVSPEGGFSWVPLGAGLPAVPVHDLALNEALGTLTAGTYGRGVWQVGLSDVQAGAGALNATSGANVWAGPVILAGNTSVGAEGTAFLQNGLATASLNIVGTISDQTVGANPRLTKVGNGNVIFSGANTYGGVTEVAVGRLIVHNPQALGGTTNGTVVDDHAALQLQSSVNGEPLTLNGNGPQPNLNGHDTGSLENVTGNNTYSGPITLASNVTIGVDTNSSLTVTGSIGDAGHNFALAKELTGTLILTAANTYGGGTTIDQGAINIQNGQALGNPGTLTTVLDGAQLQLQGGITVPFERLRLSGTGIVGTGALEGVGGANDWQGPITLAKDPAFNPATVPPNAVALGSLLNSPGDVLTIDGTISEAAGTLMGLTKVGPGIVTLTGANTYDGLTTVAAGALRLQNGSALGTILGGTLVQTGAVLELDGDPKGTGAASITVSGESLTLNGNGTPEVQRIDVTGTAGSTFTLSFLGKNTISLPFNATPAQMALALNNLPTIGGAGASVSVTAGTPGTYLVTFLGSLAGAHQPLLGHTDSGTTVNVSLFRDGGAGALNDITGNDSWVAPVTLQSATSIGVQPGLQLTVSGPVQDPALVPVPAASLSKVGAGTLVFPNVNTYTGKTFVNQGILNIQAGTTTVGSSVLSALGALVNEVQTVAVAGPLTGSFSLTFKFNGVSGTTAVLPATIPASGGVGPTASLQNALNALTSLGGVGGSVTVTKSGSTFTITFGGTLAGTNVSQLTGNQFGGTVLTITTVHDGSEGTVVASGATLQLQGGITVSTEGLTLNGNGAGGIGALDSASGNNTWATPILLGSNTSIGAEIDSTATPATLTLSGVLNEASPGTTLTKVGPGIAVLTGPDSNAYTGLTTVAGGELQLDKMGGALAVKDGLTIGNGTSAPGSEIAQLELPNQIAAANTVTVLGDGVFDLNGWQQAVAALQMTGGAVTLGAATGRLDLNGPVTASADAAGNPATVSGAGTLNMGTTTQTFTVNGPAFTAPAVADMVISSVITGSGGAGLIKAGTGVLQLTNDEAYPGPTTITQGTLLADALTGLTVGSVVLAGGTVGGTGQVGTIAPFSPLVGGTVKPGEGTGTPGNLTTTPAGGSETWNTSTSLFLTLNDKKPGDFSTLSVNGNINLGGASLAGFIGPGFKIGDTYVILTTTGGTVTGKFNEPFTPGSVFVGGQKFLVTYTATTVTLTAVQQTATVAITSSANPAVYGQDVIFTATMTPEPGAGAVPNTDTVTFTLDSNPVAETVPITSNQATFDPIAFFGSRLSVGTHTIHATFNGDSKFAPATALPFTETVNRASTSVNLSSSPSAPIPAETIDVTATFAPVAPGGGFPSGTATFTLDGAIVAGSTEPLNAAGQAVFAFSSPTAGTHKVRVTYSGDSNFKPVSTSTDFLVTVAKGVPTITISAVPLTSVYSQSVIFAATLSGPLVPTGTVTFYRDFIAAANNLGTATLDATGTASVTTSALPAGTHPIIVTYSGNASYLNSQNSTSFVVTPEATTATLTSSAGTTAFGQAVKFTANVGPVAPGSATPTGTVTFLDGSTVLGTANLTVAGVAVFGTTNLGVGTHTITASYGGTSNFSPTTSNSVTQIVQVGTLINLTSSANPAFFGQPVTITAKVKALPPGVGSPTAGETVNFYDGLPGTTLLAANVPIDATGNAVLTTSSLSVGSHLISVTFAGDSVFLPGVGSMSESVIRANTTTTVTSSLTPSVFGQPVSFTAVVAAKSPSTGAPTGTVKFYDGAVTATHLLDTETLGATDTVVFSTATLNALPHNIIAVYGGDTNYVLSQGSVTQVVNKDSTTTTVSGPASGTSVFGEAVTFLATVSPNAPGGGVPSGLVSFFDTVSGTPKLLGTGTLKGGVAPFVISTLAVGPHIISVSYGGDNNFTPGTLTGAVSQTVSKDATTSAVTSSANPSVVGQSVTYTAAVTADAPGSGIPTGTVTFFDGGVPQGSPISLLGGKATFISGPLTYGTHNITVSYSGSPSYFGSTSSPPFAQGVFYPDGISVSASPGTMTTYGQTLTFNATVAAVGSAPAVPTGTVDFFDGTTDISGSVTLTTAGSVATASFTVLTPLTAGKHNITVQYSGDVFFITNVSKPLVETVNKDGSTVAVSASTATSIYGLPVTFTAAVSPNFPGSPGVPGGTVTFWDGPVKTGKNLGNATLSGGVATLVVTTLGAAATPVLHNVNVSYAGDGNYTASNTTSAAQVTVSQSTTQTTIGGSLTSSVFGQPVTFSAVVTALSGGGVPNGNVTFFDGSTPVATVALDATGTATVVLTTQLAAGSHDLTASYLGNNNYAGSASLDDAPLTVGQDGTSVVITSSANPSGLTQPVTLTAKIVPAAPGSGAATGTATFMDGSAVLGTVKVVGGQAQLTISTLAVGDHDITVSYSGDSNFIGSNSPDFTQTVKMQSVASLFATVSKPSGVGVNVPFSITVTALDASGNRVFDDFDSVSIVLTSAPAGGALVGNLSGAFSSGLAVFGGLRVTKAGTYKVRITSLGILTTLTFGTGGRQT